MSNAAGDFNLSGKQCIRYNNIMSNRHCVYSVGGFNSIVMNSGKACVMIKTHTIYVMNPLFVLYLSYLNTTRKMDCVIVDCY